MATGCSTRTFMINTLQMWVHSSAAHEQRLLIFRKEKKSKDRLRDPKLQVTMLDHATYPLTLWRFCRIKLIRADKRPLHSALLTFFQKFSLSFQQTKLRLDIDVADVSNIFIITLTTLFQISARGSKGGRSDKWLH